MAEGDGQAGRQSRGAEALGSGCSLTPTQQSPVQGAPPRAAFQSCGPGCLPGEAPLEAGDAPVGCGQCGPDPGLDVVLALGRHLSCKALGAPVKWGWTEWATRADAGSKEGGCEKPLDRHLCV